MTCSLPPPAYRPYFSGISLARPKLTAAVAADLSRLSLPVSLASTVSSRGSLFGSGRSMLTSTEKDRGRLIAYSVSKDHISESEAGGIMIASGKSSFHLAQKIATILGAPLAEPDESFTGCDAYIVHTVCVDKEADILEITELIEKCKSAKRITVLLSDFASENGDQVALKRARYAFKDAGANRLVLDRSTLVNLWHVFTDFGLPMYFIDSTIVLNNYLQTKGLIPTVVVECDLQPGGPSTALLLSTTLSAKLAVITMGHSGGFTHWEILAKNVINEKATAIIYQYHLNFSGRGIDGGIGVIGSIVRREGAKHVLAYATHARISCTSEVELLSSGLFDEVIVTDASYIPKKYHFLGLHILSLAPMFADRIRFLRKEE